MKRNEYILDRKNEEIKFLKNEIEVMRKEEERRHDYYIVTEIVIFLVGIFFGAAMMHWFK